MNTESVIQDARENFILENFQECLKLLHGIPIVSPEFRDEIDLLTFQAYIAQQKYNVVINEVSESHERPEYRLVLLLSKQLSGAYTKEEIVDKLNAMLMENISAKDPTALLIGATIFMNLNMPEKALRVLHQSSDLMCDAMSVHCLLMMNRADLAEKIVLRMQSKNEDSMVCQLASAELYLVQGGEKVTEALNIYQELQEKNKPSTLLLNGQAIALVALGRHAEAEPLLRQALDIDPSHSASLLNMISVSVNTGKPIESLNRYISQVRDCDKSHSFLESLDKMDNVFDELSKSFAPSVSS
ncbi:Coatomer subunit epsilon [Echinococcus granulosus]|uniref:Coatomer subunit epsilon n=1 Tax=Echinococcus granulosus TaxID=6210 RepID=A0A068WHD8_ECHGR|nr:Coatomer subunit epsilon [Echinococcus granulosus]CDS17093.1 coatomer subunit epsilon [Echinococcus granulosus]